MDSSLTVLQEGIELLSQLTTPASIYPSHWPELLNKASYIHNEKPGDTYLPDKYPNYIGFQLLNNNDSFQIINKELYRRWWFEENYGDAYLPRSDYRLADKDGNPIGYDIRNGRRQMLQHYCLIPLKELCRHYDGYGHVEINPNKCPALSIPPGFFDNDIKIRYGYDDYQPDCVNIDPARQYYRILDKNGTDYKWILNDIPLFWKKRISNIYINPYDDENVAQHYDQYRKECRDDAIQYTADARMVMDDRAHVDQPWYDNFTTINKIDTYEIDTYESEKNND